MKRIGIVDTTFSRVDMGAIALDELRRIGSRFRTIRRTVPGVKAQGWPLVKLVPDVICG